MAEVGAHRRATSSAQFTAGVTWASDALSTVRLAQWMTSAAECARHRVARCRQL
jgi:hypothetical protein